MAFFWDLIVLKVLKENRDYIVLKFNHCMAFFWDLIVLKVLMEPIFELYRSRKLSPEKFGYKK